MDQLVDRGNGIIRLFTPPFVETAQDPGYIKAYPPGVRENGGQYTHAATWVVAALAEMGMGDEAYRCFSMLNPIEHACDEAAAEIYRVEPYVVAADVYWEGDKAGRGGWTWYTGSAGWMYRVAVEYILGLRRQGDRMTLQPVLPGHWPGFSATVVIAGVRHDIEVAREAGIKKMIVIRDGKSCKDNGFDLGKEGVVQVKVRLPLK